MKYLIKKNNKSYIFCLFAARENLEDIVNIYKFFISNFLNTYNQFTIYNFKKTNKKNRDNIYKLFKNKNLKIIYIENNDDFLQQIEGKNLFAIDALDKNFQNFRNRMIINKKNVYLIFIMNIGPISNTKTDKKTKLNYKNYFFLFLNNFKKKFFRLLILLNIFPKTLFYFDSRIRIIEKFNKNSFRKLILQFPFLNFLINYYNIKKINSNSFESYKVGKSKIHNKNIIFIDGNFKHQDILLREGANVIGNKKKYFFALKSYFGFIENILKKKIEIILHPSSKLSDYEDYFSSFKISKGNTDQKIYNSSLVIFHESSSIVDAIISKKKIISFETELLGNYIKSRINFYKNELGISSINIDKPVERVDLNKKKFIKLITTSNKKLKRYKKENLVSDNDNLPSHKVVLEVKNFIKKLENEKK